MEEDKFEFYRDLSRPSVTKEDFKEVNIPGTADYNPFEVENAEIKLRKVADEVDKPQFVHVDRVRKESTKRKSNAKTVSRRVKATAAAFLLVAGYGVHSLVDFAKPYVDGAMKYEGNRVTIAEMYEDFSKNAGYQIRLNGTEDEFYDAFDQYVASFNNGVGFYQMSYENNEITKLFNGEPKSAGTYTPEELEGMFGKTDTVSLGGK